MVDKQRLFPRCVSSMFGQKSRFVSVSRRSGEKQSTVLSMQQTGCCCCCCFFLSFVLCFVLTTLSCCMSWNVCIKEMLKKKKTKFLSGISTFGLGSDSASVLTPSLPRPVKFPGWKLHGRSCKQCIFWSCNTSVVVMMSWCLMSSDASWHIRDKLWPVPKHGSIILYVHGNQKAR